MYFIYPSLIGCCTTTFITTSSPRGSPHTTTPHPPAKQKQNPDEPGKQFLLLLFPQLKEAQDKSKSMEKKVERLENKLVFASEEMHAFLQARHNSALSPAPSPAPGQSASLRRQSRSVRGSSTSSASGSLLQRQNSESAATATATAFNALQRQKSESGPAALNSLQRQKSESGPTALNALPRQRSVSPERGAGGHSRAVSAPGAGRRMSSHHPDLPPSVAREQSLKKRNYRRSQSVSVSNSAVNSATNASAACAIL